MPNLQKWLRDIEIKVAGGGYGFLNSAVSAFISSHVARKKDCENISYF